MIRIAINDGHKMLLLKPDMHTHFNTITAPSMSEYLPRILPISPVFVFSGFYWLTDTHAEVVSWENEKCTLNSYNYCN
jgi:hypothetical protein